ncbi:uncharacterized protein TNCV_159441 [Trichonephila clavipes]|uniref:Uncharacterized protein n=1 Tax=Trichonephila clavipes TaxID=2585209 RepID=A0A8X6R8M8_TRICX|nr:uncharacterized protein TNCV_159441 [Trichonephila clavipes]
MAKLKNKIPPSLLCCQNFLWTILRNAQFQQQRDTLRQDAKKQIYKVQDENRRTYNFRCRQAHKYQLHDLVAIKRTQFGPGLKLQQKYLGSYKVTKVKHNDVEKGVAFPVMMADVGLDMCTVTSLSPVTSSGAVHTDVRPHQEYPSKGQQIGNDAGECQRR